jgi:hypothetical protein
MADSFILYYPIQRLLGVAPWICIINLPLGACNASVASSMIEIGSDTVSSTSLLSNDGTNLFTSDANLARTFGYNSNNQCYDKDTDGNGTSSSKIAVPYVPIMSSILLASWMIVSMNL